MKSLLNKYFVQKKKFWQAVVLFLVFKLTLLVFLLNAKDILPFSQNDFDINSDHYIGPAQSEFEKGLSPYDAPQYLNIAFYGYKVMAEISDKIYAFFPLYPFLIKFFSGFAGGNLTATGIGISFIAHFIGFIVLYKLLILDLKYKEAFTVLKFFLIYPAAIFFIAVYTESLFFMLSVLTFYNLRRKNWWLAAATGFLGAITRPPGILLFVPFLIEYALQFKGMKLSEISKFILKDKLSFLAPFFVPLGTLTYFGYLYFTTGNFFAYFKALEVWGRSKLSIMNVINILYDRIIHFSELPFHSFYHSKVDLIMGLTFLVLIIMFWRKIRFSYLAYGLLIVIFPLLSGQTMSLMRYLSVSFPHFIILGILGAKYRNFNVFITLIFALLLSTFTVKFYNWYWIG